MSVADQVTITKAAQWWNMATTLHRLAFQIKTRIKHQLEVGLPKSSSPHDAAVRAILQSTLFGLQEGDPSGTHPLQRGATSDVFQVTGTLHFFAVDGLKVTLLATLATMLLKQLTGLRRELVTLLILPFLLFYAFATGFGPASLRAVTMAALFVIGLTLDRPTFHSLNIVAACAALFLLFDTNQLFSSGFQLSFGIVVTIVCLSPIFSRWLQQNVFAIDSFLPFELWSRRQRYWERLRRRCIPLFSTALAAWIGALPLNMALFHLFSPLSWIANLVAAPFVFGILNLDIVVAASCYLFFPSSVVGFLNQCSAYLAHQLIVVLQLLVLCPWPLSYAYVDSHIWQHKPMVELTTLHLTGDGSVTHLRVGNTNYLQSTARVLDDAQIVFPYLHSKGVNTVKNFSALSTSDEMRVLYQKDSTTIYQLRFNGTRILLAGNSGTTIQRQLLKTSPISELQSDVLILGSHPTEISDNADFIEAVKPKVLIKNVDPNSSFHSQKTHRPFELTDAQIGSATQVLHIDQTGAITIKLWKDKPMTIETFLAMKCQQTLK